MVKAKAKDIKKKLEEQEEIYGDQEKADGSENVDEMYEETFGRKPVRGETIADAFRDRRMRKD